MDKNLSQRMNSAYAKDYEEVYELLETLDDELFRISLYRDVSIKDISRIQKIKTELKEMLTLIHKPI